MCGLDLNDHPDLLVGLEKGDDAGVFRLSDEIGLVQTLDFFTPIVDDPYTFGQIAAVNALSDIYAMGGTPLCAMNIACFPSNKMDIAVLQQTLAGGLSKIHEAGAVLVGGHTVTDEEFKYGLAVTGKVHPDKIVTNHGARIGDRMVLTKPLGTGIVATAIKAGRASPESEAAIVDSMATLNNTAAKLMQDFSPHACTDVTGFGLIGHAAEMIAGTDSGFLIQSSDLPIFDEVAGYSSQGLLPAGLQRNRKFRESIVDLDESIPQYRQDLLFDPQTSGGLLIALSAEQSLKLVEGLKQAGISQAAVIGEVVSQPAGKIIVR